MPIQQRNYIDNAPTTTTTAALTSGATSVPVTSAAGFPSVPFWATIDLGLATSEQVLVTAVVGSTLTVTRNANGMGAFTHSSGANFQHTAVALDYQEANNHTRASSAVHGITGSVVGTTDAQTLTNKSLTSPQLTGTVDASTAAVNTAALTASSLTVPGAASVGGVTGGLLPTGALAMWLTTAAPTGWLVADGSAVSRTTYPALFTLLGTTFGAGDGSTTFNLPDLRAKFPLGASAPGGVSNLDTTGGASSHSHALSANGHAVATLGGSIYAKEVATTGDTWGIRATASGWSSDSTGGALATGIALAGATDVTNTLPPYLAVHFIIKAA